MPDRTIGPRARATRTRTGTPFRTPVTGHLLKPEQLVLSPETRLSYRVRRLLGEGGFGQVYLARRLGRSAVVPATLCIKVSDGLDDVFSCQFIGD